MNHTYIACTVQVTTVAIAANAPASAPTLSPAASTALIASTRARRAPADLSKPAPRRPLECQRPATTRAPASPAVARAAWWTDVLPS